MRTLEPDNVAHFLARFSNFYDAVLHEFSCKPGSKTSCELVFESQDSQAKISWIRVIMRLESLTSWKFAMPMNSAYYIISGGVHIFHADDLFYLDVGNFWDESSEINDYLSSDFHFVARAISWTATPIK